MTASRGGGGVGLGKVYRKRGQTIPFLGYITVSITGGVRRFLPVVMMLEKEDATGVLNLFQMALSFCQLCYVALCSSLVKIIVNICRS